MGSPSYGLYLFHESDDSSNTMYFRYFDGQTWSTDTQLQNPNDDNAPTYTDSPSSGVVFQDALWCFYRRNGVLRFNVQRNGNWQTGLPLPVAMSGTPSAVIWQNKIYVFYQGAGNNADGGDGLLHFITCDGSYFSFDRLVPIDTSVGMSQSPSAISDVNASQQLEVYRQGGGGSAGQLRLTMMDPDGSWLGDWQVAAPPIANSPAAIGVGNDHYVFFQGTDQNGNANQALQYVKLTPASSYWYPHVINGVAMNTVASPSVAALSGRLYCFFRVWGSDTSVWCVARAGGEWQPAAPIPGMLSLLTPGTAVAG